MLPFSLNCKGQLLHYRKPVVMGIINLTNDSFYAGSRISDDLLLNTVGSMLEAGADWLDLGGQSTRPNASILPWEEELDKVLPAVEAITKSFPSAILSIDTFYSHVAQSTLTAGAQIINDVSGGIADEKMMEVVGKAKAPYIIMHRRGDAATMAKLTQYDNLVAEVAQYLVTQANKAKAAGIHDIIIDPGFGFAKTIEQNFALLKQLPAIHQFCSYPILAGWSRKSSIYKTLKTNAEGALNGTTVLNTLSLQYGASILRVHDVKEAVEAVKLYQAVQDAKQ